jgi:hypothetical protein
VNDDLDRRADAEIKAVMEKMLGKPLDDLRRELIAKIEKPQTTGHQEDLIAYMKNLPVESWRDWSATQGKKLETELSKEFPTIAETLIKNYWNRKTSNDT